MRKLIILLMIISSTLSFAGSKSLRNGIQAYWDDTTEVIQYNSYRVEVKLTDIYSQNVWGTITLVSPNKSVIHGNLFIPAGELKGYVDFDGLNNGIRYGIKVKLNN